eukprot:TRINITY_DN6409_c0_g1_i1.p3 TRINITY_DN6409_c0_g1~~TRINITY_DN6409_c0_g1_i1.p3  ORF type:complete len:114 (+),score=23.75 TRINITY_DN6409_c0_g1_i1:124-465(+)
MIRRPPRSTLSSSSAASDVYKRQVVLGVVDAGLDGGGVDVVEEQGGLPCDRLRGVDRLEKHCEVVLDPFVLADGVVCGRDVCGGGRDAGGERGSEKQAGGRHVGLKESPRTLR